MCEVPPRRLRPAIRPERVILALVAVAALFFGLFLQGVTALVVLGLGAALLVGAVLFPVVRDVEFGFPSGVKISTALRNREQELREAFDAQRGDLNLYAQLLCDDLAVAVMLLEAAWAKTAAEWRGHVTPYLRLYVLCTLIHLLDAHERWAVPGTADAERRDTVANFSSPLTALPTPIRMVVVLHEFADLDVEQIAEMTERTVTEVTAYLRTARGALNRPGIGGGAP
jgi:DNA-directed RNA polymerase specialized sigma24 family protein